ncbi:Valyl-tRNA synthetase [uncultured Gammaproteobacteria bacterium]
MLDTWFSSALWPFSTLGWPDDVPELKRYYPGDVLVTGFDIIFFWVARMMMMGLHFMGEVPFHTVYIHALVRDERGHKMSKSKGNVIDPLDLINEFGCDALRFTLTALSVQGRDVKLARNRVEGYRNFVTKLWNAARYAQMNGCTPVAGFDPAAVTLTVNRWIVGETARAAARVEEAIAAYRFNDLAGVLYQFLWNTFCDWYLEFTKPIWTGSDEAAKAETRATTAWVLEQVLHLLHPVMPFITEELWEQLAPEGQDAGIRGRLISARWPELGPELGAGLVDDAASAEMDWAVRLISAVRAIRSELNVPPSAQIPLLLLQPGAESLVRLAGHRDQILRLARLSGVEILTGPVPEGSAQAVLDEITLVLPLAGVIDLAQERARLKKEIDKHTSEIAKVDRKLGNAEFMAKAPEDVVEENRERRTDFEAARERLTKAMAMLG